MSEAIETKIDFFVYFISPKIAFQFKRFDHKNKADCRRKC